MFSVYPSAWSTERVISIENGMASATKTELSSPIVKKSTTITSSRPLIMLLFRSVSIRLITRDSSKATEIPTPAGTRARASASTARTRRRCG